MMALRFAEVLFRQLSWDVFVFCGAHLQFIMSTGTFQVSSLVQERWTVSV